LVEIDNELNRLEQLEEVDEVEESLKNNIDVEPDNLEKRLQLAKLLKEKNRPEEAIDELLQILAIDRNYKDKEAYNTLLETFT